MMFTFDPTYFWWVFIPTILISFAVQIHLRRTFKKYGKIDNQAGLTGEEVAEELFEETSLEPVPIQRTKQPLGDHYDPKANVVRLSPPVGQEDSISAMSVTAHELGHVEQYQEDSGLIKMRGFLMPAVQFSPMIMYICAMLGLIFNMTNLLWVAVFFFGITVVFALLTLPVEFNASKRGMGLLEEASLFKSEEEVEGARKVLTAAALTYVAAFITSVMQLIYYITAVHEEAEEDKAQEARKEARQEAQTQKAAQLGAQKKQVSQQVDRGRGTAQRSDRDRPDRRRQT